MNKIKKKAADSFDYAMRAERRSETSPDFPGSPTNRDLSKYYLNAAESSVLAGDYKQADYCYRKALDFVYNKKEAKSIRRKMLRLKTDYNYTQKSKKARKKFSFPTLESVVRSFSREIDRLIPRITTTAAAIFCFVFAFALICPAFTGNVVASSSQFSLNLSAIFMLICGFIFIILSLNN